MKHLSTKSILPLAMAAGLLGTTTWSTASHACATDPVLASVCIMATPNFGSFNNAFVPANGALLPVSTNAALFSLISNTYGGNGTSNFAIPNLSGRVVVGSGLSAVPSSVPTYSSGTTGGAVSVSLSSAQMPAHIHPLGSPAATVSWGIGGLTATTTMTGLSGSTNLNGIVQTGLTLNASQGGTLGNNPLGASLGTGGTAGTNPTKIYSDAVPSVAMKNGSMGSIGGTLTGTAPTTITGSPTTTFSGAPTLALSGATGTAGMGAAVPTMPPFLAMSYYIATNGTYPMRD